MRPSLLILAVLLLAAGCAKLRPPPVATAVPSESVIEPVITSVATDPIRIAQVNTQYRFVVLDFGRLIPPPKGSHLIVSSQNHPIATVQLSGPIRGRFATADVLDGDPRVGDDVQIP